MKDRVAELLDETNPVPEGSAPSGLVVKVADVREPELPARASMSDDKFAELVESMRELGLINPITLVGMGPPYEVVAGHRRLLAARELGWEMLPARIYREKSLAIEAVRIHENICREDLNPAEEAVYYGELLDRLGGDFESLCSLVHRSDDYVSLRFGLLRGDPGVFDAIRAGKISFAVGRELNKCADEKQRAVFLDLAIRGGHAARVVARWVAEAVPVQVSAPEAAPSSAPREAEPEPAPNAVACYFCGGSKDPYNLRAIYVHTWELEHLEKLRNGKG